jgi:hypothetical protein
VIELPDSQFRKVLINSQGLVMDEKEENLFVVDQTNNAVSMISLLDGTLQTIAGSSRACGYADGVGSEATFDLPFGIARHKKTGDFFVTDNQEGFVRKISRVKINGTDQWVVTSIPIFPKLVKRFFSVTVFHDMLYLSTHSGIIESSLDGKTATIIANLTVNSLLEVAVNANGIYVAECKSHSITKIEFQIQFWSPDNHQRMQPNQKSIVGIVVVASRCNLPNSKCQLRRLPRDVLFYMLSFLNNYSIGYFTE